MSKNLWIVATKPPEYLRIYSIQGALAAVTISALGINALYGNNWVIAAVIGVSFFGAWCVVLSESWLAITPSRLATDKSIAEVETALKFHTYHKARLEQERKLEVARVQEMDPPIDTTPMLADAIDMTLKATRALKEETDAKKDERAIQQAVAEVTAPTDEKEWDY